MPDEDVIPEVAPETPNTDEPEEIDAEEPEVEPAAI